MNIEDHVGRSERVSELWRCAKCGEKNPEGIDVCLACGAGKEMTDDGAEGDAESRRVRISRLREEVEGGIQWQYLTLVFKVERDGSIGSTFPGRWMHEMIGSESDDGLDAELNAWGSLGWELVSIMPNSKPSLTREAGETTEWLFVLKRRVEAPD
jgi:hypothetical protein